MKVYDGSSTESVSDSQPDRIKVGIAEYSVATGSAVLTTSGLGSCLGIAIYDTGNGTAGLVHAMLPSRDEMQDGNDAKFADSGIETLLEEMEREGASKRRMEAKIAGGSDMLDFSENGSGIGMRNIERGKETLEKHGIPVVGEDVGGDHGRSLQLETATGDLIVKSANREEVRL